MCIIIIVTITVKEKNMKRYSKQREVIINVLKKSKAHPSAAEIYLEVKKEIPNISLGTVYRNLNNLKSEGEILCFNTNGSKEHFDGNSKPHHHFYCTKCGKTQDVFIDSTAFFKEASSYLNGEVNGAEIVFSGICTLCKK